MIFIVFSVFICKRVLISASTSVVDASELLVMAIFCRTRISNLGEVLVERYRSPLRALISLLRFGSLDLSYFIVFPTSVNAVIAV